MLKWTNVAEQSPNTHRLRLRGPIFRKGSSPLNVVALLVTGVVMVVADLLLRAVGVTLALRHRFGQEFTGSYMLLQLGAITLGVVILHIIFSLVYWVIGNLKPDWLPTEAEEI
ncbi:MAG: hypothetical protein K8R88_07125 [Armatimonadetes bacterium]|nr:hypothetical protein [Armatimonadota bacterium]